MEAKVLEAKAGDVKKMQARVQDLREHVVKELLFDPVLNVLKAKRTPPKAPKPEKPRKAPRQSRAKKTVQVLPPLQDGELPVVIITKQKDNADVEKPKRSLRKVTLTLSDN
jgi:hypothetical protein